MNREFPAFFDLPQHGGAGFVVGFVIIFLPGLVDLFHPFAGGDIVGIDSKHLLVALGGEIVAATRVIAVGFDEELGDFVALLGETGSDRFVVVIGLLEIGEQGDGRLVGRIVLRQENGLRHLLRIGVFAVVDQISRVSDAGLAELVEGLGTLRRHGWAGTIRSTACI